MSNAVQVKSELVEIGREDSGWMVLYFNKSDGSFWELTYPNRGENGGGEPTMNRLSRDEVILKYNIFV
jgi:hypothetical protein